MRKHLHWAPGSTPVQAANTAYLLCPHNSCIIEDDAQGSVQAAMNEGGFMMVPGQTIDDAYAGRNVPENRTYSQWSSGLASPFVGWGERAERLVKAEMSGEEDNRQTAVDANFGEVYSPFLSSDMPVWQALLKHRSDYGPDLNVASAALLTHVAGLSPRLAEAIVAHRDATGAFAARQELLKVSGLGAKAFEQAAGFLRIRGGKEPLDASSVHPEAYGVARRIVAACGRDLREIMGNGAALAGLRAEDFVDDTFGLPTVRDILSELEKPGRDPRPSFKTATFADGVEDIKDLKPGMMLEGTVTNVAAFGAFVDIGVHQDGLVHISQLADRFVKDPHEVVKAGDLVKVRVVEVDIPRKRIGLTMRKDSAGQDRAQDRAPTRDKASPGKPAKKGRAPKTATGTLGDALQAAMKRPDKGR